MKRQGCFVGRWSAVAGVALCVLLMGEGEALGQPHASLLVSSTMLPSNGTAVYDIYNTFGNVQSDSHTYTQNVSNPMVSTSALAMAPEGFLQLNASASANESATVFSNQQASFDTDYFLDTDVLPAGTPEQYLLSVDFSYNLTSKSILQSPVTIMPTVELGAGAPGNDINAGPLNLFGSASQPAAGSYSQLVNFQAGELVVLGGNLSDNATLLSASTSTAYTFSYDSSLTVTLTAVTPLATYSLVNVPEPRSLSVIAPAGLGLLRRRRRRVG
jgi:hypothetical protein